MTEREMLELAARAGCYETRSDGEGGFTITVRQGVCGPWNPLEDDGDALRLAVKLNLLYGKVFARSVAENNKDGDDIYAATRLAIVLAAAEIGRLME